MFQIQLYSTGQSPDDIALAKKIEEARWWASSFLTNPHEDLGRSGAVCPFTKTSLEKDLFWVGAAEDEFTTAESLVSLMSDMANRFESLPAEETKESIFKTVLVLLPNVKNFEIIDEAHEMLKSDFIVNGLMIGQFYPGCDVPGLWNPSFRPLDAPIPMLVVRHMVATDFPFISARPDWVERYLRKFAPALPAGVRSIIVHQFDEAA